MPAKYLPNSLLEGHSLWVPKPAKRNAANRSAFSTISDGKVWFKSQIVNSNGRTMRPKGSASKPYMFGKPTFGLHGKSRVMM